MHTWYVEGIALKIVDGFWTTTRIVANPISLRYFSIFTFFSNDYSSVTFPFLRNIILEFFFSSFLFLSFFFSISLFSNRPATRNSSTVRCTFHRFLMRVPIDDQRVQFIIPRSDAFYQAAFLIESGARDHSCRPIFKREPSGHPRTPRVRVRGPKWQSCSVSYVTPPRLLCFSLGSLSEINITITLPTISIDRSIDGGKK